MLLPVGRQPLVLLGRDELVLEHGGEWDIGWDTHSGLERQGAHFEVLFKTEPWLIGSTRPPFHVVKNMDRRSVPEAAQKFYHEDAYKHMVTTFGKILIRNHETEKFKAFFMSQNCQYMTNGIVAEFLRECVQYLSPECAVPIYATYSSIHGDFKWNTTLKSYTLCESDVKVSEQQI